MKAANIISAALCVVLASSCGNSSPDAVAHLGDAVLTMEELRERIPNNISAEDSAALAQEIIQSWFDKYEIKTIVVKRYDKIYYLEE